MCIYAVDVVTSRCRDRVTQLFRALCNGITNDATLFRHPISRQTLPRSLLYVRVRNILRKRKRVKGKGSPYSITERMVPELIPVLGCDAGDVTDVSHKPGSIGCHYFPPGL